MPYLNCYTWDQVAKCRQMSLKVDKNDFTSKIKDRQKLPKNVGDLGKLIVAKALKSCSKSNKSPNLVTLYVASNLPSFVDKNKIMLFAMILSPLDKERVFPR